MPRSEPENESLADLRDTVHDLAGQVQILREVLDEIREHIHWAATNDKLVIQVVGSPIPSVPGTTEVAQPASTDSMPGPMVHSGRHRQNSLF